MKLRTIINKGLMKLTVLCSVFFISLNSQATEETYSVRKDASNFTAGSFEFTIEDGRFYEHLASPSFVDAGSELYIKFGVEERDYFGLIPEQLSIEASVVLTPIDTDGTLLAALPAEVLSISYSPTASTALNTYVITHSGRYKYLVSVTPLTTIPENIYIEAELNIDRYYEIDMDIPTAVGCNYIVYSVTDGSEIIVPNLTNGSPVAATGELEIFWDYIEGAEEYELEWTWIDNYSNNIVTPLDATMEFNEGAFEKNNTRVLTNDQRYRIPLVYGRGFLIYRVRGVGRWLDNSFLDVSKPKFGKWSTDGASLAAVATPVSAWPNYIEITTHHEALKNWQYQAVYAENGKKKDIISYFDGSLRNRQTVTRINSDHNAIVGENIYDNQGRSAIQILPTPVGNPALRYFEKLNVSAEDGKAYDHTDFDWDAVNSTACITNSIGMSVVSGASKYYSSNNIETENWQDYVPDADQYPFVQMEYTPDNTGRTRKQSGVGGDYKIDGEHATRYFYLQARQEELDRLFGYMVGFNSRYKKNMVVDANGQVSVSYFDPQGRVIATAFAGSNSISGTETTTNLMSLDSEDDGTGVHLTLSVDLLNKVGITDFDTVSDDNNLFSSGANGAENDGLRLNTQLGSTEDDSPYDFVYNLKTDVFTECGFDYPFAYELHIDAKDDCGESVLLGGEVNEDGTVSVLDPGVITAAINDPNAEYTYTFNALLDVGSYTVTKRLQVDAVLLEEYAQQYIAESTCLLTPEDFLEDNVDCNDDLDTDFGDLAITACTVARAMLIADVSPYGQYGAVDGTDNMSVFSPANFLEQGALSLTRNWENPVGVYTDEYGVISQITVIADVDNPGDYLPAIKGVITPSVDAITGELYVFPQDLLNVSDFIEEWETSWAESLIAHHPEFPYLTSYEELCNVTGGPLNLSSESYDATLLNIATYAEAKDPGNALGVDLVLGNNLKNNDPYFDISYAYASINGLSGNVFKTTFMDEVLADYKRVSFPLAGLSLWDFCVKTYTCGTDLGGTCSLALAHTDAGGRNLLSLPVEVRDQIWGMYKLTYLGEKKKINQVFIDAYAITSGCYNGYIGEDAPSSVSVTGFLNYMDFALPTVGTFYNTAGLPGGPYYESPPNTSMLQFYLTAINVAAIAAGDTDSAVPWTIAIGAPLFVDKVRRFIPIDNLYDSSVPEEVMIASGAAETDAAIYDHTGRCDLSYDVEYFLNSLAENNQIGPIQVGSGVNSNSVPVFTTDLYQAMGGEVIAPGMGGVDVFIGGSGTPTSLTISGNNADGTPLDKSIVIYKSASTTWDWTDIQGFSTLYFEPGTTYDFKILASINNGGTIIEVVLEGNTDIQIGDCFYSESCERAGGLATDFDLIIKYLFDNGNLYPSAYSEPMNTIVATDWYAGTEIQTQLSDYGSLAGLTNDGVGMIDIVFGAQQIKLNFGSYPTDILYIEGSTYDPLTGYLNVYYVNTSGESEDGSGAPLYMQAAVGISDIAGAPSSFELDCDCEEEVEISTAFENLFNYLITKDIEEGIGGPIYDPFAELLAVEPYLDFIDPEIQFFTRALDEFSFSFDKQGGCEIKFVHQGGSTGDLSTLVSIHDLQMETYGPTNTHFYCKGLLSTGELVELQCIRYPCINFEGCSGCVPTALIPQSCTDKYPIYNSAVTTYNTGIADEDEQFIVYSVDEFCAQNFAYYSEAYLHYISVFGITSGADDGFLTLEEFGNTNLGDGFVNSETGDDMSAVVDDYQIYLTTDPDISWGNYVNTIYMNLAGACPQNPSPPVIDFQVTFPCEQLTANVDTVNAINQYDIYIQNVINSFKERYVEEAVGSAIENFDAAYADKEYHYTLYYYDQAGNLIQTVPPAGVDRIEQSEIDEATINSVRSSAPALINPITTAVVPEQKYETNYEYNTLNQMVYQRTPDGGESYFAYDYLGRLVVSQNAKQKAYSTIVSGFEQFSYTRHDGLGRIIEVGEMTLPIGYSFNENGQFLNGGSLVDVAASDFPHVLPSVNVEEVTKTVYDESLSTTVADLFEDYSKYNTRNRITGVLYFENYTYTDALTSYDNATFYDYDVHGNVKELVQDINDADLEELEQDIKKTNYEYDLVSGNVKHVTYQEDEADQFIHEYEYDADNRITNVRTSANEVIWEQDAKYFYYLHGPLARTEIGDQKVQANDYAYAIQGWLKGVNSETLLSTDDQGKDGKGVGMNRMNGKDVFGYSLNYFNGDYKARHGNGFLALSDGALAHNHDKDLYNGNIKEMFTASTNTNEEYIGTSHTWYQYDQLNRIRTMDQERIYDGTTEDRYAATYTFDANGNLDELTRDAWDPVAGLPTQMDNFKYYYDNAGANPNNQLLYVHDLETSDPFTDDLGDQSAYHLDGDTDYNPSSSNYDYDAIGQLIQDKQEDIKRIEWKVTGKVSKIIRKPGSSKSDLEFVYDAMGNRIIKIVKNNAGDILTKTYYIRGVQGNCMSIYTYTPETVVGYDDDLLKLTERSIYGSSRVGTENVNQVIASTDPGYITINEENRIYYGKENQYGQITGDKRYELSNHLGNVLEVITDRKLGLVVDQDVYLDDFNTTGDTDGWEPKNAPYDVVTESAGTLDLLTQYNWNGTEKIYTDLNPDQVYLFKATVENLNPTTNALAYVQYADGVGGWLTSDAVTFPAGLYDLSLAVNLPSGVTEAKVWFTVSDATPGNIGHIQVDNARVVAEDLICYVPDVVSQSDYYPFGMLMPNRHDVGDNNYRYGFNGKEEDDEFNGDGNIYDYGFRIYNVRLGKFLSVDPLTASYPWYTPYQFAGNKPIAYIDLDGLEELKYTKSLANKGEALEQVICSSTILTEVYERVTDPTVENTTIFVGTVDYTEIGKGEGWNARTIGPDEFSGMINTMSSFDKYKEDNKKAIASPDYQYAEQLEKQQEKYDIYEKQFEAIGFTYKEIEEKLKSGEQIYVILINESDLDLISSDKKLIEVVNSYIHEIDAHLEEMLNGDHESSESDHGKYFKGEDENENKIIDGIITGKTTSDGKPKSPSVKQYGTGSEAEINHNAVTEAVNSQ